MKFVKYFKSSFFTALLECGPGKRVDDGVDARGIPYIHPWYTIHCFLSGGRH